MYLINIYIYIYIKTQGFHEKRKLGGHYIGRAVFYLLHMHNKYEKYIRNIILAIDYIRIGIWNDII